jgi:prepilin-type N-terminal cleavage/methylation domain-containing protein
MTRRAFTLMELLVVIVIIGMLASMALGSVYLARESAREAKTKATITKLDRIIQARYEEFASRRLPIKSSLAGTNNGLRIPPQAMGLMRLQAIRWIAKSEMPDHRTDVSIPAGIDDDVTLTVSGTTDTWQEQMKRSSQAKRLFRACGPSMSAEYDVAELLYMIVMQDPDAKDQFYESEIGDLDGDGSREFQDAWGMPIFWLRWPTGYESELMTGDPDSDHDTLDSRKSDPGAFRTVPLIWSFGPDKKSGLDICDVDYEWDTIYSAGYGKPVDASHDEYDCHLDNITNHSLGMN